MATVEQIHANRQNAQSSTGPRTPEGKLASSRNALKSGIWAESEIIPGEDPAHLEALKVEYYERYQPATPEARDLVDSLVRSSWLLRRLAKAEPAIIAAASGATPEERIANAWLNNSRQFEAIQRRINAINRNYHRDLKALQSLPQAAPTQASAPAEPPAKKDPESDFASFLTAYLNPPFLKTKFDPGPISQAELNGDYGDDGDPDSTPRNSEDLAA